MGQTEKRLEQLGITLPKKDRRGKGTVPVKQAGDLLYVSAQLPLDDAGTPVYTGRVGTDLTEQQGYDAARRCGINTLACLTDYIGDLDRVECIVKVLGLVNSGGDFSGQPAVVNGFSDLMLEVFGERGMHARSAMGAYSLPMNVPVAVDCIIKLR
ncbi:RidA family protein [Breznakiella homolactica]|uniref:RidA family protein n=1 Tax=Breznakiella homolactica TaxID=2798577 RepID=A0A7T8BAY4_9SPIR|nr:RidA family protein [Breznakiella homolactica]QQO11239.1 RidA family protein [Breznakiella homolactica]